MADTTIRGRFVWRELMTSDASSAHSFYTKVLGWKTQAWEQDPSYTMFVAARGPLGGTWETAAGAPHWLPYIGTPDIAATLEQARSLGARVSKDITEMSNGGKYAVLDDPQGAAFGIYQSASEPEPYSPPKRGEYSWHELMTSDYRAAFEFYSALFGWQQTGEHDMGEMGAYFMFGLDGNAIGGMFNRPAEMPGGPAWLGYVRVKDVHQAVKKVTASGGTLLQGPMEVPGGDWIAQFADPQGAMFAVHTLAADLRTSQPAAAPAAEMTATAEKKAPSQSRAKGKQRPAKKSTAATKTTRKKASRKTVAKAAAKKAAKTSKKSTKKAAKKAPAKARRKAKTAKRGAAARSAKRPARKAAKTARKATKKRSAAKQRAVKRPRKAK